MAGNILPLSTILSVSVMSSPTGASQYNTSNLAIFTRETPASTFGTLGYQIYLSAIQVGIDFGTSSHTYQMAVAVFSQQPNIIAGGGYLVIIPFLSAAQTQIISVTFPGTPTTGTWELTYNANSTSALSATVTSVALQTALQLVAGLASATVTGSVAAGFTINSMVSGIGYPFTISANTLADASGHTVTPVITVTTPGSTAETLDQAIIRTQGLVAYFGVLSAEVPSQIVTLAAAALVQTLNKLAFFVSYTLADIQPGGILDLLRTGSLTQSRGLFYGDTLTTALEFVAAYAGRALSVDFNASLSTITMHCKSLATIQPDPATAASITSILSLAAASGADIYVSVQGVSMVLCSGANDFFDNQYNLQWFAGAIQVAGANFLIQTGTKVPQTEDGMNGLKGASAPYASRQYQMDSWHRGHGQAPRRLAIRPI